MNWSTTHENNRVQYPQTCILWILTLFFAEKAIQTSINELYWTVPFIGDRQKKITRLSPCLMTSLESPLEKGCPLNTFKSLQSDKQSQNSYKVLNSKEIYNIRMWSIHYPKYFHTSFIHRTRSNPFRTITLPLFSQRWASESVLHFHERNSRLERMRRSAKRAKPLTCRKDKERPTGITRNAGVIL